MKLAYIPPYLIIGSHQAFLYVLGIGRAYHAVQHRFTDSAVQGDDLLQALIRIGFNLCGQFCVCHGVSSLLPNSTKAEGIFPRKKQNTGKKTSVLYNQGCTYPKSNSF